MPTKAAQTTLNQCMALKKHETLLIIYDKNKKTIANALFKVGKNNEIVFSWILHVDVWIKKEDRIKSNEFVFARSDISCVLMYRGDEIVLIKEVVKPTVEFLGLKLYRIQFASSGVIILGS